MRKIYSRTLAGTAALTLLLLSAPTQAYQGMWIDGSEHVSEFGKHSSAGRGVTANTNLPSSMAGMTAKWTDNNGNLWVLGGTSTFNWEHPSGYFDAWFGSVSYHGEIALRQEFWKFDPGSGNWTDYTSPGMPGFSTANTATWTNSAGDLYIMDALKVHRYNIQTDTWNHVSTHPNILQFGTQGIPDGSNSPGIRYDATMWVDNDNNVWMYGGRYIPDGSTEWEIGDYRDDVWMYNTTTMMWTWVSGSNIARDDLTPIYGTRGVFSDSNRPPVKYWEFWPVWVDSDNNLWTYQWEELWKYDTSRKQWAYITGNPDEAYELPVYGTQGVPSAANNPGYRFEPAAWVGGDGNLWMFGGVSYIPNNSGDGFVYPVSMGDVWYFDRSAGAWVWADGPQFIAPNSYFVSPNVAAAENQPAGRSGALAWRNTSNRTFIFGGRSYKVPGVDNLMTHYRPYNDTWSFNRNNNQWTYLKGNAGLAAGPILNGSGQGDFVPGLRGSSTWTDSAGNLWMFGGTGWTFEHYVPAAFWSELLNNAMWKFDLATLQWKYQGGFTGPGVYGQFGIEAPGNTPGARLNAASWPDPQGYLWLFGGEGYDVSNQYGYLNDLWRYNPATGQWAWFGGSQQINTIFPTHSPTGHQYPSSRAGAAIWHDGNGNVAMFGGHLQVYKNTDPSSLETFYFQRQTNDLWYFSCATREWYQLQADTSTITYGDFVSYDHTYFGAFGNYGTRGVPSAGNRPGGREEAVTWIGSDGHLYMYGGFGFASSDDVAAPPSEKWPRPLADMWRLDIATMQWTWAGGFTDSSRFPDYASKDVFSPLNQPGSRLSAIAWSPGPGRLAMMGGRTFGDTRNGIWTYDIASGNWSWSGIGNAHDVFSRYGNRFSLSGNNLPGQRVDSAFWELPGGMVAIFGGEGFSRQGYGYLNDSWVIAP